MHGGYSKAHGPQASHIEEKSSKIYFREEATWMLGLPSRNFHSSLA